MSTAKSPARQQNAPPSSPRLPSPPPLPELQLGPTSPGLTAALHDDPVDEGASRRVRPGTTSSEMAKGPPFVPLHQLETPFQLQEYLKSSYCTVTTSDSDTIRPITKETALQLANPPIQQETGEPVDRHLWLYELCRFLVQRTNRLIVSFFSDDPPCSSQTCPEMRASEWQYLCAVHEPPKSCCAIDYCCHTLDWAANVLTSTRHFPSRLALGGDGVTAAQSMKQLTNIFRRVYRIYAHAWFQHRERFWMLEQEEGLYKFFKTVSDAYQLIPEDNYTVPPEAEGEREDKEDKVELTILRHDAQIHVPQKKEDGQTVQRRHRHTPSTGVPVNPIAEGEEEEEVQVSQIVAADAGATTTVQDVKPPRSPRPEMSIPIERGEIGLVEDPTPTPERHDPFDGSAQVVLADGEVEPPTPLTAVEPAKVLQRQSQSKQDSKAAEPNVAAGEKSSFDRTTEVNDAEDVKDNVVELTASPEKITEADLAKVKAQQLQASAADDPTHIPEVSPAAEAKVQPQESVTVKEEVEDDEQMEAIPLEKTTTAVREVGEDEQPKPEKADPVAVKEEKVEKNHTPSGVV